MEFKPGDRVVTRCRAYNHAGRTGTVSLYYPGPYDSVAIALDNGDVCSVLSEQVEFIAPAAESKVGDRVVTSCGMHPGAEGVVTSIRNPGTRVIYLANGDECWAGPDQVTVLPPIMPKMRRPVAERSAVLAEADKLINGDRQAEYGPPSVNFQRIADMWHVLFPERNWTTGDVARAMVALKLARTPEGFKRDTAVDMAAYAALYAELEAGGAE